MQIVLMWGGGWLSSFCFCVWLLLLLLKKDFEGLINVFPLYGGSGENFGKSRMQEKPSSTFLRLILYLFIFH